MCAIRQASKIEPVYPALERALTEHRAGRLDVAEELYREALQQQPNHPEVLHLLGVAALQAGRVEEALESISRAITIDPEDGRLRVSLGHSLAASGRLEESLDEYRQATLLAPDLDEAWFAFAVALQKQDRHQEAIDVYRQVLQRQPDYVDGHLNLGSALESCGQFDEAVQAYQRAIRLQPERAEMFANLASVLHRSGRVEEAVVAGRRAIELDPESVAACNNLGLALTSARQWDDAIVVLRRTLVLQPQLAEGWYNLGNALMGRADFQEAASAYRRAVELQPERAETHINLGNALQALCEYEQAVTSYRRALSHRPDDSEAYNNLGTALRNLGQVDPAIDAFRRSIALRPAFHVAHCNLGNALKDAGHIEEAVACYRRAIALCPGDVISHSNLAYSVHFHPGFDAVAVLAENRNWEANQGARFRSRWAKHANDAIPDRRLRIGYVGSDFRDHCQSLFTLPLFSHHDHQQFEIFCYANVPRPDALTDRIRECVDGWRPIAGRSDDDVAEQIRADQIDILVDLTMHMSNGRPQLMARKPAPVQVAYLAYPGTTGMPAIDYRLTDPYLDPPGETDAHYAERSLRLPETFWCYDPLTQEPTPGPLPASAHGRITFGCLNNFCKVTGATLVLWARLMNEVDGSRLILLAAQGSHRQRVLGQLRDGNIDAARVEFVETQPRRSYLDVYRRIDIVLDTLPYNGHTTSLDALWMGVPVVTRVGRAAVGRAGLSQLSNLGLPELAARSDEEFIAIASTLAGDRTRLAELRATLRGRMEQSPLMDAARFTANVESAYRWMWQEWCVERRSNVV